MTMISSSFLKAALIASLILVVAGDENSKLRSRKTEMRKLRAEEWGWGEVGLAESALDTMMNEDQDFWSRALQASTSMPAAEPSQPPILTKPPSGPEPSHPPALTKPPTSITAAPAISQRCGPEDQVSCGEEGQDRIHCCVELRNGTSLTICPPRFLVEAILDFKDENFCGECQDAPSAPSAPSVAPVPPTDAPVIVTQAPTASSPFICDPLESCEDGEGFFFCAKVESLGINITLCIPNDRGEEILEFGECGACPAITPHPTSTPYPTDEPTEAPTEQLEGCDPVIPCDDNDDFVTFCFQLSESPGNVTEICVPPSFVQSLLPFGECGTCPGSPSPTASPSDLPIVPAPTPATTTVAPSPSPSERLENCAPIKVCEYFTVLPVPGPPPGETGIVFCLQSGDRQLEICADPESIQELLELGGTCGDCPTEEPTESPTGRPSSTPSLRPTSANVPTVETSSPTVSVAPSAAPTTASPSLEPTGQLEGCDPIIECGENGENVIFCLPKSRDDPASRGITVCLPKDSVQEGLEIGGYCGYCPTDAPSSSPTDSPTSAPTSTPTNSPTGTPTIFPTNLPTELGPTLAPTGQLDGCKPVEECGVLGLRVYFCIELRPGDYVTICVNKEDVQDLLPLGGCGSCPTDSPTLYPTDLPSELPSEIPSELPSESPTEVPTARITATPTIADTNSPTKNPTSSPTVAPVTSSPTGSPSKTASAAPTARPTTPSPTSAPQPGPTNPPTISPTNFPTRSPTETPTTRMPTVSPTKQPTDSPSASPTSYLDGCDPVVECDVKGSVYMCLTIDGDNFFTECVPPEFIQAVLGSDKNNQCGPCDTESPTESPTSSPTFGPVCPDGDYLCIDPDHYYMCITLDDGTQNTVCVHEDDARILLLDPQNGCGKCEVLECSIEWFPCPDKPNQIAFCHAEGGNACQDICTSPNGIGGHENHCDFCGVCPEDCKPRDICASFEGRRKMPEFMDVRV